VNALNGSIPSCLTASMRVLTLLDLSRNALSGTLPPELVSAVPASLGVSVFDNQVRRRRRGALPHVSHATYARTHAAAYRDARDARVVFCGVER
jgi:hypothetical protein